MHTVQSCQPLLNFSLLLKLCLNPGVLTMCQNNGKRSASGSIYKLKHETFEAQNNEKSKYECAIVEKFTQYN